MALRDIPIAFKTVFSRAKYIAISFFIALLFFAINIYIPNTSIILNSIKNFRFGYTIPLLGYLFAGGMGFMMAHTLAILIIISILFGAAVSLMAYRINNIKAGLAGKKTTAIAVILGFAAPGCAVCGIGLLPLLGLGSVIAYLPFQGLEIGILSIGLLVFSISALSKGITRGNLCAIQGETMNIKTRKTYKKQSKTR